jgi:hypothetical protein
MSYVDVLHVLGRCLQTENCSDMFARSIRVNGDEGQMEDWG